MLGLALGTALAAAVGLLAVRSAPPLARLVAWAVVSAFALVAVGSAHTEFVAVEPRTAHVPIGSDDAGVARAAILRAAGEVGPRARDLELRWNGELPDAAPVGAVGARATLPVAPLPIDPRRVRIETAGAPVVDRPLAFAVGVPGLDAPVAAEFAVRIGAREVMRQQLAIDGRHAAECAFVPAVVGEYAVELSFGVGAHRVVVAGAFAVSPARNVLVLEPSGVAAAALRTQGVAVDEADRLPADWRERPAIVVGRTLGADEQQSLVAAVIDGMGVFVLAPGFGAAEAPMRALLPLRPEPGREPGPGAGAAASAPPTPSPPHDEPDPTRPPVGETSGAARVLSTPVDVDKRSIAMVLVVDRSGSMGNLVANGFTKMSYAKTSALRTALALGAGDAVGIVTFGDKDEGHVELPMTDAADIDRVRAGIERLASANERTFLLSGLRAADALLAPSTAAVKHVVVITDGEFDLAERVALHEVARQMRDVRHATVSVVSVIDQFTDQSFKREAELLTRVGGGQFLPVEDPTVVPVLVSAEVTRALRRVGRDPKPASDDTGTPLPAPKPPTPDEPPPRDAPHPPDDARVPVRAVVGSPLLAPLPDPSPWPTLGAAVAGKAPLDASVLLVAGDAGWPLLAFGNRGLGRVGAFAADLCGPAGAEFRAAKGFAARFAQWVQHVQPALPARAPQNVVRTARTEDTVPTTRDVALLERICGEAPAVGGAARSEVPAIERRCTAGAREYAPWLAVALVLLALAERYAGSWALRRRSSA